MRMRAHAALPAAHARSPGLVAAVQAAHGDLVATAGAVLVTGGGLGLEVDAITRIAVDRDEDTLAIAKAAQRKAVALLAQRLAGEGVYVAQVTVQNVVRGTWSDKEGKSPLTAEAVADEFWRLAAAREPGVWQVGKSE